MIRKGARIVAFELIREPVKEAVREALREEAGSIESSSGGESNRGWRGLESSQQDSDQSGSGGGQSSSGGGRSKLGTLGIVLAIAGIAYFARRRMSSTSGSAWSEQSAGDVATDDAEGGYVSEGEMQTAETADQDSEGAGTSPSTAADQ